VGHEAFEVHHLVGPVDIGNQTVFVTANAKDDGGTLVFALYEVGVGPHLAHFTQVGEIALLHGLLPLPQGHLSVRMTFPKGTEGTRGNGVYNNVKCYNAV
jgi:hypothetical protein